MISSDSRNSLSHFLKFNNILIIPHDSATQTHKNTNLHNLMIQAACETFCLGDDVNINEATGALSNSDHNWTPNRFRIMPVESGKEPDICEGIVCQTLNLTSLR